VWSVEESPEIDDWVGSLSARELAVVRSRVELLQERGSRLRLPHSRSLGGGLLELRFNLDRRAWRITYCFGDGRRIMLLTVFRKQRQTERVQIRRARRALALIVAAGWPADGEEEEEG